MEFLAVVLLIGALWGGHKIGADAGRKQLLDAQSLSIETALSGESEFFQKTGLHGAYLLEGHEYSSPSNFVIVKFSDLERALAQRSANRLDAE